MFTQEFHKHTHTKKKDKQGVLLQYVPWNWTSVKGGSLKLSSLSSPSLLRFAAESISFWLDHQNCFAVSWAFARLVRKRPNSCSIDSSERRALPWRQGFQLSWESHLVKEVYIFYHIFKYYTYIYMYIQTYIDIHTLGVQYCHFIEYTWRLCYFSDPLFPDQYGNIYIYMCWTSQH